MTARRPRRSRRAPATALPRPTGGDTLVSSARSDARSGRAPQQREHHVTKDYTYVRGDLAWVAVVSLVTTGAVFLAWLASPTW